MNVWILAADSSRARIFSAEGNGSPLQEVVDLVHPEGRWHERDFASDEPGTGFDRVGQGQHAMGQRVSPKREEAQRFANEVCSRLDAGRQAGDFDRLYVIAAPSFLGMLRGSMTEPTRRLIAAEVDKNVATQRAEDIRAQLPERL
jgi:protein required for attachment to host cells